MDFPHRNKYFDTICVPIFYVFVWLVVEKKKRKPSFDAIQLLRKSYFQSPKNASLPTIIFR